MKILQILDNLLLKIEEMILSWAIIIITLMVVGNVLNRAITGSSWSFASEVGEFAIYLATFMGIGYVARSGRHISMSAFFDLSPQKVKKVMIIIVNFFTSVMLFIYSYYAFIYLKYLYGTGRVTSALEIPVYILIAPVPLGLFLGALQFLRNTWVNFKEKEVYLGTEQKDYALEKQEEE